MRLGILQAGENSKNMPAGTPAYPELFTGLFDRAGAGFDITFVQVRLCEFPSSVDDYDAYLVTGSAAGVYDDLDWIAPLEDFIRQVYSAGKPLAGICFGHQLSPMHWAARLKNQTKAGVAASAHYLSWNKGRSLLMA